MVQNMVLKFKVWKLTRERRGAKVAGSKLRLEVVCLRDKDGKLRRVAKSPSESKTLETWYEKYQVKLRLESLITTNKLKKHVRRIKQRIRRRGFKFQMSFYGVWRNPKTNKPEYRRYEVFKAEPFRRDEVSGLHDFLKTHVPVSRAGIFVFHNGKLFVDKNDELTNFKVDRIGNKP